MTTLSRLTPALLRAHPQFRRFWTGQTVSLIGDQVTFIALPLVAVLELDASAAQMGYLTAAALIPNLLFSLRFLGARLIGVPRTPVGYDLAAQGYPWEKKPPRYVPSHHSR